MSGLQNTFCKKERLNRKIIIDDLYSKGHSFFIYPIKVNWIITDLQTSFPAQVIINVSKRNLKKAVDRNRIKRLIREVYRKNKNIHYSFLKQNKIQLALSLIYVASETSSYKDIEKKIILILQRLIDEMEKKRQI